MRIRKRNDVTSRIVCIVCNLGAAKRTNDGLNCCQLMMRWWTFGVSPMSIAEKRACMCFVSIDVRATSVLGQNFCIIKTVLVKANVIYYKHIICLCKTLHILTLGVIFRHEYIHKERSRIP